MDIHKPKPWRGVREFLKHLVAGRRLMDGSRRRKGTI
jgi:hypothetical protein